MGLQNSKEKERRLYRYGKVKAALNVAGFVPEVTEREGELLREMWDILKEDIAKVGVITFVR